jgi:hypothetical protein
MIKTQLKHWVNGYRTYGGSFKTLAFNIGKYGFMVMNKKPYISTYKFTDWGKLAIKALRNLPK